MINNKVPMNDQTARHKIRYIIEHAGKQELLDMLGFLYRRQTDIEQMARFSSDQNGRGFSYVDAEFLSSVYVQASRYDSLTDRQAECVRSKLKKYWKQLGE